MKITITGSLYSGKSTTAKNISQKLNLNLYSVGKIQRRLAEENGMSITEYNKFMEDNHLDYKVDEKTREIGETEDGFIFDGRLAWHFIPKSYKIFLHVNIEEAIKRALRDNRGESEYYNNSEEARARIIERRNLEICRFNKIYNIDLSDTSNYDLVIDTSNLTMEEVFKEVKNAIVNNYKH